MLILFLGSSIGLALAQSPVSGDIFYFHLRAVTYRSENASVTVVEEANLTAPSGLTPRVLEVAAAIRNATTIFGTIWVGSVAWVTEPLRDPTTLSGTATFTVWLSSDDVTPSFSGAGAGIAVLNQQNQTVGNYRYAFTYARGKALTGTPTLYSFDVDLNQNISAGQRLVFAVGVGSTTEGWRMNVFFDDGQHSSGVQLPTAVTVVPEFDPATFFLAILIPTILTLRIPKQLNRGKKGGSSWRKVPREKRA
jgi:hypothetical protein